MLACTPPIKPEISFNNNDLDVIQRAYKAVVQEAHQDQALAWRNGRFGNFIVNVNGGNHRGLCYHWQRLVYHGIQGALHQTGWRATGIAINEGSFYEHHAVLVFDPARSKQQNILKNPKIAKAYVLDPWSSGEARIYTIANWLKLPVTRKTAPRLTKVIGKIQIKNTP